MTAAPNPPQPQNPSQEGGEEVWTFRGYRIGPSQFTTAMIHLYRGEVARSNTWRTRLDNTTNWAVVATGAALSFAFSGPGQPHFMIILNTLLVALFLYIEARRYRYYELWATRVRMMEIDFFAAMLVPPFHPGQDWAQMLAASLLEPEFTITIWEALGRRFRRNYLWMFALLALAWAIKIIVHPATTVSRQTFLERAAIGPLSGQVVVAAGAIFNALLFAMGILTIGLQRARAEVLPEAEVLPGVDLLRGLAEVGSEVMPGGALPLRWPAPRNRLAFVITTRGQHIAERLLYDLRRGVTALNGVGMYTGEERNVLLCAIRPTEVHTLKAIVRRADPDAFVIVSRADEIIGRRFDRQRPAWLGFIARLLGKRESSD
jgi:uncharacterized membrane protein